MFYITFELWCGEPGIILFKTFDEAQAYIDEVQKEIDAGEYDECAWIDSEPTEYEFGKVISCSCD